MKLKDIVVKTEARPHRLCLYGGNKLGKTRFACKAPKPVFIATEDGVPSNVPHGIPETFADVLEFLDDLIESPNDFQTVVIDTLDWLEPLIHTEVCQEFGVSTLDDPKFPKITGYGGLYRHIPVKWDLVIKRLEKLQKLKGMNVIMIAHEQVKNVNDPSAENYQMIDLKLVRTAKADICGKIRDWVDTLAYVRLETAVLEGKVKSTDVVEMLVDKNASYASGSRYALPPRLPLDWEDYAAAVARAEPAPPGVLLEQINELCPLLPEDAQAKLRSALEVIGNDAPKLAELLNRVKAKVRQ